MLKKIVKKIKRLKPGPPPHELDDCFQLFLMCKTFVAQKLQISKFLIKFFCWTPATFGIYRGRNCNLNMVSNFSWICELLFDILYVVVLE